MHRHLHTAFRHTWLWTHRLAVVSLLLAAVLVSAARWWLPHLDTHRAQIEDWLSHALAAPVSVGPLAADWHGWGPALAVSGLRVRDPRSGAEVLAFDHAIVELSPLRSLLALRPVVSALDLRGVNLLLRREADGRLGLLPASGEPVPLEELLSAAAALDRVDLRDGQVHIEDPADTTAPLALADLRFTLRGGHAGRRLAFDVHVAGGELYGATQLTRIGPQREDWDGRFYLRARGIDLAMLPLAWRPQSGRGDAELWGTLQAGWPTLLRGRIAVGELQLAEISTLPGLAAWLNASARLALRFDWTRTEAPAWHAIAELDRPTADGNSLPPQLEVTADADGMLTAVLHDAPLTQWGPWLAGLAGVDAGQYRRLAPGARLPELALRLDPRRPQAFAAAARVEDLHWRADGALPGAERIRAKVQANAAGGRIELDSPGLVFDAPAVFRAPFVFGVAHGRLGWTRTAGGWRVGIDALTLENPALAAVFDGSVELPDGAVPLLDLHGRVSRLNVAAAPAYLPDRLIGAGISWLDAALLGGRGRDGVVRLRGRVSDFPFSDGNGEFLARFHVDDGVLHFAPGWPDIRELSADVVFAGPRLDVDASHLRLLDLEATQAHVAIADLEHTTVEVQGRVTAEGEALQGLLRETPLRRRVGRFADELELRGPHQLTLEMNIPTDERDMSVRGQLDFLGSQLALAPAGWTFTDIRGALDIDGDGVHGRDIALHLGSEALQLDAQTAANGDARFRLDGRFSAAQLLGEAAPKLLGEPPALSGSAEGTLVLSVPGARPNAPQYALTLDSDLEGIAVRLPAPLGKSARERRALALRIEVGARERARLSASYGDELRALLDIADFPGQPHIERGDLRYGDGEPRLPNSGVRLGIDLPRYAWTGSASASTEGSALPALPSWLTRIEASIGELQLAGQRFERQSLVATPARGGWQLALDGPQLSGSALLPPTPSSATPYRVTLQRLFLRRGDEAGDNGPLPDAPEVSSRADGPDPRRLPALNLSVDELRLDERPLGRLTLSGAPVSGGYQVQPLELHATAHDLNATLDWRMLGSVPRTRLDLKLVSRALGDTLAAFGYGGNFRRAPAQADARLEWPLALPDIDLAQMQGSLKVHVDEGQLLEANPGVGRLLGLVSLSAIARRLTLDFRDFFGEGFGFDRIDARFRFADGKALTEKLEIEGPAASISVHGETDLVGRSYDQRVTVTPRLTAALPIAGALAGGPVGAAAGLLVDRLLGRSIDRLSSYHYDLKGPWQSPQVEPSAGETPPPASAPAGR